MMQWKTFSPSPQSHCITTPSTTKVHVLETREKNTEKPRLKRVFYCQVHPSFPVFTLWRISAGFTDVRCSLLNPVLTLTTSHICFQTRALKSTGLHCFRAFTRYENTALHYKQAKQVDGAQPNLTTQNVFQCTPMQYWLFATCGAFSSLLE